MVIPGHNLGNSQVSVNRTIGPTLVSYSEAHFQGVQRRFVLVVNVVVFLKLFSSALLLLHLT